MGSAKTWRFVLSGAAETAGNFPATRHPYQGTIGSPKTGTYHFDIRTPGPRYTARSSSQTKARFWTIAHSEANRECYRGADHREGKSYVEVESWSQVHLEVVVIAALDQSPGLPVKG